MYTALIKLPNGSKPKDLSDFHLTTIVGCAASISLIALIILNVFPAKVHPPGGPLLQSAAIVGSILLILSCLFIMGKRFGRNGKNGFKGHVWLASIGAILVIVHSGFSILSIPGILLYPTIAMEIILPLFIIFGYNARLSAGLLAIFCLSTAFIFHFDFADQVQTIAFLKNIGLAGGFLFIVANGTKEWSIDNKKKYVRL